MSVKRQQRTLRHNERDTHRRRCPPIARPRIRRVGRTGWHRNGPFGLGRGDIHVRGFLIGLRGGRQVALGRVGLRDLFGRARSCDRLGGLGGPFLVGRAVGDEFLREGTDPGPGGVNLPFFGYGGRSGCGAGSRGRRR